MSDSRKVYVVTRGEYSDYHITGIFSTRENADRHVAKNGGDNVDGWVIDEEADAELRTVYESWLWLGCGTIYQRRATQRLVLPDYRYCYTGAWHAVGKSTVNQEHADKLVVEARQKWLRESAATISQPGTALEPTPS